MSKIPFNKRYLGFLKKYFTGKYLSFFFQQLRHVTPIFNVTHRIIEINCSPFPMISISILIRKKIIKNYKIDTNHYFLGCKHNIFCL